MSRDNLARPAQSAEAESSPAARQGFALAGALLALVVVGALVTGSFFAAAQEGVIGISAKYNDEAMYVAEYALNQANAATTVPQLQAMTGPTSLGTYNVSVGGATIGSADVWVRPLGPAGSYYLFVARGTATRGGRYGQGTRVLGLMTHIVNVSFPQDRAMQVYSGITVQGSALVSGQDVVPSGAQWDTCTVNPTTQNAIVAKDTSQVDPQKTSSVVGSIVEDTTMNANSFLSYGDFNFDMLAAMADKKYPADAPIPMNADPVADASGNCLTANPTYINNWGEPFTSVPGCRDYFPIIYVNGDLHLSSNGRGQGILLVTGNLDVTGGFQFYGITIVKGSITTSGNGGHLNGTVMAYNTGDLTYDPSLAIGNSLVQLSGCAVRRATRHIPGANRAVPVRGHSWIDLSATGAGF